MTTAPAGSAPPRPLLRLPARAWLELAVLAVLAVIGIALFSDGQLDRSISALWYRPEGPQRWPAGGEQPWLFLYRYGGWPGIGAAIAGALVLLAALPSRWGPWPWARRHWREAMFAVLAVAIGPGLLVHTLLKDNWDRPRPRDTAGFGGERPFQAAWVIGAEDRGKSFPTGHGAIGFILAAAWLPLAARRRQLAALCLLAGTAWGIAIGSARIAAGGHWASDVWWSAVVVWLAAWVLWHLVLRAEARPP